MTGGEQVTLAIVFTDVVGSTALGEEIRDEAMNEVRRAHFAQSRRLIGQFQGREIKTIGDSFSRLVVAADVSRLTLLRRFRWSGLTSAATGLKWERHEGVAMKGFPGKFTLWAVK